MTTWTLIIVFALPQFEWAEKEYDSWFECRAQLKHIESEINYAVRRIERLRTKQLKDIATYGCFPNWRNV